MIPYFCKLCGQVDDQGIHGHVTSRCKPVNSSVNKIEGLVHTRAKYGSKDKEARKAYRREWMRRRRAQV